MTQAAWISTPKGMEDLLALMQAGDPAALDLLVRSSGPRLLAVAHRCCRSPADAEDAVQQALVSATTSMRGFRGDGSPVAWLSTLVARSCYRFNRAAVHEELDDKPCEGCASPEKEAQKKELAAALGEGLMRLPRVDRLAFLLAVEGASSEEIAARFGLTSDAVRSRLKRSRKKLRAFLGDTGLVDARTDLHDEHEAPHR